jgi:flavin reductase (DIM6/NTAB) family NADH-FMN oxidoreductase RutF
VIDPKLKRALGQMVKGVQVVGATHEGVVRAYTSHWVSQVAFEEPVVMASVSPKHDTYPLIVASGEFTVSILAGDQVDVGQYFSYPGRKFRYIAEEYLESSPDGLPVVRGAVAWLTCETFHRIGPDSGTPGPLGQLDHELFFARVTAFGVGRLKEPPLLYSSRHGWRITGDKAREPGTSVRDRLLERLAAAGFDAVGDDDETVD